MFILEYVYLYRKKFCSIGFHKVFVGSPKIMYFIVFSPLLNFRFENAYNRIIEWLLLMFYLRYHCNNKEQR